MGTFKGTWGKSTSPEYIEIMSWEGKTILYNQSESRQDLICEEIKYLVELLMRYSDERLWICDMCFLRNAKYCVSEIVSHTVTLCIFPDATLYTFFFGISISIPSAPSFMVKTMLHLKKIKKRDGERLPVSATRWGNRPILNIAQSTAVSTSFFTLCFHGWSEQQWSDVSRYNTAKFDSYNKNPINHGARTHAYNAVYTFLGT